MIVTPEQRASDFFNRWPYKSSKTEAELKALREDIIQFCYGKPDSILKPIFDEFISMKPPSGFGTWWLYSQVKSKGQSGVWWRICENHHIYQDRGSKCPICGSLIFKLAHGDSMPSETIMIQESCSTCPWYKNNDSGLYGSSCSEYGTDRRGQDQICKDCQCKGCCDLAYIYHNDPEEYRRRYGEISEKKFAGVLSIFSGDGKSDLEQKMIASTELLMGGQRNPPDYARIRRSKGFSK